MVFILRVSQISMTFQVWVQERLSQVQKGQKLTNIEALADVTDFTNVAAAGAVMNTGDETIAGAKTFSSTIVVYKGNAATVTNGIYTSSSVTSLSDVSSVGSELL